jgi:hypothetical protein
MVAITDGVSLMICRFVSTILYCNKRERVYTIHLQIFKTFLINPSEIQKINHNRGHYNHHHHEVELFPDQFRYILIVVPYPNLVSLSFALC